MRVFNVIGKLSIWPEKKLLFLCLRGLRKQAITGKIIADKKDVHGKITNKKRGL